MFSQLRSLWGAGVRAVVASPLALLKATDARAGRSGRLVGPRSGPYSGPAARAAARCLASFALLAGLFGGSSLHALTPQGAQVVGKFELGAPDVSSFVLRGTLPVPPGTFPRPDGKHPFGVVDANGATVPAQCEIVSRYPVDAKGADVVELLARVQRPAGVQPGARITYNVVSFPHTPSVLTPTPAVASLFAAPGLVTLRAKDVFHHEYRADLLRGMDGVQPMRSGLAAVQTRYYEAMRPLSSPVGPPSGPLPRLLNAHSYVTQWLGEDMVSVDLRVNNASSGRDSQTDIDNPQDKVYFQALELWFPATWNAVIDWRDPAYGPMRVQGAFKVLPIVAPIPTGELHMVPPQGQFERRIVLVRSGFEGRAHSLLEEQWLGFCRRGTNTQGAQLYSWWNPATANYFPQRHRLPALDHVAPSVIKSKLSASLAKTASTLTLGGVNNGAISSPALGWAHPWGVKYGGMTSGTEIFLYDGVQTAEAASTDGYRLSQMSLRMYLERNPTALFNKDGNPTTYKDWITHGPSFDYIYMQFYLRLLPGGPDPFGFGQAPRHQVDYVAQQGKQPPYEATLLAFKPIDLQHQIRITRSMKVLTWLGNDALAKEALRMHAEIARLSYHEYPVSPAGAVIGTGMLADIEHSQTFPGIGLNFGRGEGWTIDTMAAAYSINSPAWRSQALGWFDQIVPMLKDGQASCSGVIQRTKSNKLLGGLYYARQSIEQAIVEHGLMGMLGSVYRGTGAREETDLKDVIRKSTYSMVQFPAWSDAKKGPWSQVAVAPIDDQQPPFCGVLPPLGTSAGIDKYQAWSSFAYGYELTGDPVFLQKALIMGGGSNLLNTMKNGGLSNLENRAALIALAQTLP